MSEQDTNQANPTDDFASQLELEPEQPEEAEQPETKPGEETPESVEETETPADPVEQPKPEEVEKPSDEEQPEEPQETEAERNRRFYEMRQQAKREAERAITQTYQPQAKDELVQRFKDEGYDDFQASLLADNERRNQETQINAAKTEVAELNMQIESESLQVMHDYPIFDPKSPEYDKDFADKASALYHRAAGLQVDKQTGLIVNATETPYKFYKDLADMRSSGLSKAQMAAQRAAEQQMAAAAPPSSTVVQRDMSPEDKQAADLAAAFDKV